MSVQRLIRRVGFQEQEFERHRRHKLMQAMRARIGDRTAESDVESHFPQLPCLLDAAGKTVHDAVQAADAAPRRDDFVDGAPRVQDDRQAELARELQLTPKIPALFLGIEAFDVEIQAALADGDGTFVLEPGRQFVQMRGPMLGEKHRMQAVGGVQTGLCAAKLAQLGKAGDAYRRNHLTRYARGARANENVGAVGVEFTDVEVRVAVEQLHDA